MKKATGTYASSEMNAVLNSIPPVIDVCDLHSTRFFHVLKLLIFRKRKVVHHRLITSAEAQLLRPLFQDTRTLNHLMQMLSRIDPQKKAPSQKFLMKSMVSSKVFISKTGGKRALKWRIMERSFTWIRNRMRQRKP
jgi:hypothetical protein